MTRKAASMYIAMGVLVLIVAAASCILFANMDRQALKIGDLVLAEWSPKIWYPGKIESVCEKGFNVHYDDGDKRCLSSDAIIHNKVPSNKKIKVGTHILAQWSKGPFYEGVITGVIGGQYSVQYYDRTSANHYLSELRLDPRE